MQFIFSHADLVDSDLMQGVIYNQDKDISLVLIQIHESTLKNSKQESRRSYA